MRLREATDGDLHAFARVFADAIRHAGPDRYTPSQVDAWAASAADAEAFGRRLLAARTIVAEDASGLVGFVTFENDGHVEMLYVRGDRQRRGVGGRLLEAALAAARAAGATQARAAASAFSLPVFLRAGFEVEAAETVVRGNVRFERHRVTRRLAPPGGA